MKISPPACAGKGSMQGEMPQTDQKRQGTNPADQPTDPFPPIAGGPFGKTTEPGIYTNGPEGIPTT